MTKDREALREIFQRDGFVQIDGFLDPGEADEVEHNVARFIRDNVPTLSKNAAIYQVYGQPETLKQVTCLEIDAFFSGLLFSTKIQGTAEALLGERVVPQSIQFFNKPPRTGMATPPHQDGYYFCLVPNEAITVWIALDDINSENGALHYWKGSHKKGVLDHTASYVLGFSQGLANSPEKGLEGETVCHVKRGGCLIHHSLMVHAACPNTSERSRRALGLVYYGESARLDAEAYRRYQESVMEQRSRVNGNV
jgi:phytanoyl-CoA hydroxylase